MTDLDPRGQRRRRTLQAVAALGAIGALGLTGCSGRDEAPSSTIVLLDGSQATVFNASNGLPSDVGYALAEDGSDHVRVYHHDAVEVLQHEVADGSLDEVRIYFPDPWHKKRHNKRRLVKPEFAALLVRKLAPGGRLHLATDWQDYAEQMWDVLDATAGIANRAGVRGAVPRPDWRPQTHFETRGQKLGHGVWDLLYDRLPEA